MLQRGFENNQVYLIGEAVTEPVYSHEVCGEKFYEFFLSVKRLSGHTDRIPLVISERIIDVMGSYMGTTMEIFGQFRSRHIKYSEGARLSVQVFVYSWAGVPADTPHQNEVWLKGFVCRSGFYRTTTSAREVSDMMIAVERQYGKCDFIPCIIWGRNAHYATTLKQGQRLKIGGRIQNRDYTKKAGDEIIVRRRVYEVSVSQMECLEGSLTPETGTLKVAEQESAYVTGQGTSYPPYYRKKEGRGGEGKAEKDETDT